MFKVILCFLLSSFISCMGSTVLWASDKEHEVNTGQDFTKPLTRLDIRQKYQDLPGGQDTYVTTLRADKPIVLNKQGWVLSLRADLPLVSNDRVSADNRNGDYEFGVGDFLNQVMFIAPQGHRKWTYGIGSQFIWPTASQDQMGNGRFEIAPLIGAKVNLDEITKGSIGYLLLREHIDAGGDSNRASVNYLVIQPGINLALPRHSFLTLAPEIRVNWENQNRWFVPFDITLGTMLNKTTVVSIQYKTPIVDHKYPVFNHEVEARVGFFF